jgi:acyl-CoA thioesterase
VPVIHAWARLADGREPDTLALGLFADALPPVVFNAGLPLSWVPTLELTVHVRARPAPGWVRIAGRTRLLAGGYLDEEADVWDADGRLVATARQLALAPREPGP